MIFKTKIFAFAAFMILDSCQPNNPTRQFSSGKVWQDTDGEAINAHGGGILFQEGVYYWYGEHKGSGIEGNKAHIGIQCYSSTDLYHWENEGVALGISMDSTSEIVAGCVMERPKVIFNKKTGKYVMWFHLELKDQGYRAARTGLAISDDPLGPFVYQKSFRPNSTVWPKKFKEGWKDEVTNSLSDSADLRAEQLTQGLLTVRDFDQGQMSRDMTLFVDEDGKAYHIHSAEENYTLHISELTDDYQDFTGNWIRMEPGGHNEAPTIFKRDETYYMITSGCTGWDPNAARSFKAKSIWGPWEPLGNPAQGKGAEFTFQSQSTFVLPVQGKTDAFIFMADRWNPKNPIDGRYVWLPVRFENGKPTIRWYDQWALDYFDQ